MVLDLLEKLARTGTPSINGASNVSSITDLGTGVWRVNFTNPMPNTDYAVSISAQVGTSGNTTVNPGLVSKAVDSVTIQNQAEYTGGVEPEPLLV